jgi:glycopeptide antibiotics resistance protein
MVEVYILLLISTTILPVRIINPSLIEQESRLMDYVQLFPFRTIKEVLLYEGIGSIQIIGNIILFIPLPILIAYTSKKHNTFSVFIKSFFAPMGIEIIQFCMDILLKYPSRKFDVDDIILNTTGILIGLFIFKVIFYFKNP